MLKVADKAAVMDVQVAPMPGTAGRRAHVDLELTVLMPCLNEAETIGTCIRKARRAMRAHGVAGEVLVADNGSTDGSRQIAVEFGARVVTVEARATATR